MSINLINKLNYLEICANNKRKDIENLKDICTRTKCVIIKKFKEAKCENTSEIVEYILDEVSAFAEKEVLSQLSANVEYIDYCGPTVVEAIEKNICTQIPSLQKVIENLGETKSSSEIIEIAKKHGNVIKECETLAKSYVTSNSKIVHNRVKLANILQEVATIKQTIVKNVGQINIAQKRK